MSWLDEVRFDSHGLVPVITQAALSGEVLMVAYANREALERSLETGYAHYWSRSRQELWKKGETSGNVQQIAEVRIDCDGDAVLYRVAQAGPACHTGNPTCFFRTVDENDALVEASAAAHIITRVDETIESRMLEPKAGSYTNYLLDAGLDKILKKVGEEATEVVIAAKNGSAEELGSETADLVFHLLVMLRAQGLPLAAVWEEMERRFGKPPRERSGRRDQGYSA
ncbi:MAG: bifunctional phosphoribosyl-AMP cyclohydrolase/phosphoribosyl-ATP diphosphatase HisIE [Gemmatimonadota bacterium]|jgi:phosphoribosyl-ATP pyrophosphohydrolase/phosphoribosyl-AMP cyclohydrolase|nr:bifunctional phosphoribosyl-AMP cyclohydrolase/phosphoribosyl-ATP diphosphatase HisIE [Gemmatimonadota bacterium]